jgi:hypothetical protein
MHDGCGTALSVSAVLGFLLLIAYSQELTTCSPIPHNDNKMSRLYFQQDLLFGYLDKFDAGRKAVDNDCDSVYQKKLTSATQIFRLSFRTPPYP